jgi:hypothetical protein
MVAGGDWSMMQSLTSRLNLKNCGFEDSSKGKPLNYSHSWDKRFIKKTQKKSTSKHQLFYPDDDKQYLYTV